MTDVTEILSQVEQGDPTAVVPGLVLDTVISHSHIF